MTEPNRGEQKAREELDRPARVEGEGGRPRGHTDDADGGQDSSPHETKPSGEKAPGGA